MSEFKPTNQLRFIIRGVEYAKKGTNSKFFKILQQLWIEEYLDENGNGDIVRFETGNQEWRDVECINEDKP